MRFTRIQMIIITLAVFLLGTSGLHYLLRLSTQPQPPAQQVQFEGETVIESNLAEPKRLPLKKGGEDSTDIKTESDPSTSGLVNINTAQKSELMKLKELGSTLCDSIILFREEGGAFKKIDDLLNVEGMTPEKFERIKSNISIGEE
ncbi:ComEA family DNA-binding protein [candidate division CSSED10-310 bacterium]|uniref:ComEA family DNA-binding protein n=1 Tax=candidate division CSSED10-310 bacterium TaxID=2855610 RepID=A0ABV6YVZ9_UNCC1